MTYKSLQKRRWKLIHYFWLLRPNCQLEYCIKREKTEYDICYASGQNLPCFNFIFLLAGNCKKYNLRSVALCLLHGNLQVPYWKLFGLLTQTSIFSNSFQMWHNRRKAFFRDCCPRSTSFNDTAIVRNFYPKKFWSRQTFHLLILCNCCCLLLFTIKLLILLLLFACSEVRIFRENVILAVKISQVVHRAVGLFLPTMLCRNLTL